MTKRSIFDICGVEQERIKRASDARIRHAALAAEMLGAEREGNNWVFRCKYCNGFYRSTGVDTDLSDCHARKTIAQTMLAAWKAASDDEVREIVERVIGADAAEGES